MSATCVRKGENGRGLKQIKVDKFKCPDEIYPRVLREAMEDIVGIMTEVFLHDL